MSGTKEVCWSCQGEYQAHDRIVNGYRVSVGWCPECNQARLVWEDKAYEDPNMDVDSESAVIGKELYDRMYNSKPFYDYRLIDVPTSDCRQCIHAYKGEKGIVCRYGKPVVIRKWKDVCEDYKSHHIWAFERTGYKVCPKCGHDAFIMKKRTKCYECGWVESE
jgi:ssDNA-binding Zn-finger/Zn-ribbon topoisomerase 1